VKGAHREPAHAPGLSRRRTRRSQGEALEHGTHSREAAPRAELGEVAEDAGVAGVNITGRRRRPSGERAPLEHELGRSGVFWLACAVAVAVLWAVFVASNVADPLVQRADDALLRLFAAARTPSLTQAARWATALASVWTLLALRWGTILALGAFLRLRHLLTFVGSVLAVRLLVWVMSTALGRPPPTSVSVLGDWRGYADPSAPVAMLAVTVVGMSFALAPDGRARSAALRASAVAIALLGLAQVYLGVSHPSDVLAGVAIGVGFAVVAFRLLCPDAVFPVRYRRRRLAHLELDDARIEGIREAVRDQLGLEVVGVEHVGLEGSGGSTPLLITLTRTHEPRDGDAAEDARVLVDGEDGGGTDRHGGPPTVFGKLYADAHLRADRWYKLAREILYGSLEDETTFNSVRQLVEYEDYMMRVMRAAGLPTPRSHGFVELSPEREYLMLSEYVPRAEEADEATIDEDVIDQGLAVVQRMWEEGLAHRDVKPANILLRDGRLYLIDVAFGQVRPSAWRQAVDLANMMLVLAIGSDAEAVYRRAIEAFDPDDVGEAFAATHGITMPGGLRRALDEDGRDLVAELRRLAPERPPIRVQRWSVRRVALTARTAAVALVIAALTILNLANPSAP
jgi:tRNA A-37 threonylcarbamoyl transferase component Bud32/membrane-associated phospholipid phosphatase